MYGEGEEVSVQPGDLEWGQANDRINMMAEDLYRALWDFLQLDPHSRVRFGLEGLPDPDDLRQVYVSDEPKLDTTSDTGMVIPTLLIGLLLDKKEER